MFLIAFVLSLVFLVLLSLLPIILLDLSFDQIFIIMIMVSVASFSIAVIADDDYSNRLSHERVIEYGQIAAMDYNEMEIGNVIYSVEFEDGLNMNNLEGLNLGDVVKFEYVDTFFTGRYITDIEIIEVNK